MDTQPQDIDIPLPSSAPTADQRAATLETAGTRDAAVLETAGIRQAAVLETAGVRDERALQAAGRRDAAALTSASQREINAIWENTQMKIALAVIGASLAVAGMLATFGKWLGSADLQLAAVVFLFGVANLVTGFYFGRTNHARTGGIGGDAVKEDR